MELKGGLMSGTDELVFYGSAGGADYPTNRNLYRIVNIPSGKLICSAMTQKSAREIIERLPWYEFQLVGGMAERLRRIKPAECCD
jgi:hypothetical protein